MSLFSFALFFGDIGIFSAKAFVAVVVVGETVVFDFDALQQ